MLNNIKSWTKKVRKMLVYLEVVLRNAYLCARFQGKRLWKSAYLARFPCFQVNPGMKSGENSRAVLTKTVAHEICQVDFNSSIIDRIDVFHGERQTDQRP